MSDPVSVPSTYRWTVHSDAAEADYRVTLSVPLFPTDEPMPLLVLLDGTTMFLTATEFSRTVSLVTLGDLPPIAVMGITRDTPDPMQYFSSRFRDFTPQEWDLAGPFADDRTMARHGMGGAGDLLDTIEHLALPLAREVTAIDPARIGVGGWSLSGLFACWAWLERPDLFAHLLAISPSIWWHHASLLDTPFPPRPPEHRAFVCAGEHEEGDVARVWPQRFADDAQRKFAAMVRNAERFGELATASGAITATQIFTGEHHVTVMPAALSRGLLHLFA